MDLDEELDLILQEFHIDHDINHNSGGEAIAAIKQAFADAGYMEPVTVHSPNRMTGDMSGKTFMTGSEWYERFKKETQSMRDGYEPMTGEKVDKAARRASGIDKEGTKNGK